MRFDLAPRSFWRLPTFGWPTVWDDDDEGLSTVNPSGLSVSEDEKNVYVEAALPGIDPKDVEITLDKGILWIKGEAKEEEKQKKFYRKSARSFSYRVAVPGDINTKVEPNAVSKNGVMKVTFAKSPAAEPKKIAVKEEK